MTGMVSQHNNQNPVTSVSNSAHHMTQYHRNIEKLEVKIKDHFTAINRQLDGIEARYRCIVNQMTALEKRVAAGYGIPRTPTNTAT